MKYILDYNNMLRMNNVLSSIFERQQQLDTQEKIDDQLLSLKSECPQVLVDFLLLERQLNRVLSKKYENINLLNILKISNRNITINQNEIDMLIKQPIVCDHLEEFNKGFKKRIKDYQQPDDT